MIVFWVKLCQFSGTHLLLKLVLNPQFQAQSPTHSLIVVCTRCTNDVTSRLFQASSPAATELETIVMDWLGNMLGLPNEFLHSNEQTMGGGVIQVLVTSPTTCLSCSISVDLTSFFFADDSERVNVRGASRCSHGSDSSRARSRPDAERSAHQRATRRLLL